MAKEMRTKNYQLFRHLEGNRDVLEDRISKIDASVKKIGWMPGSILVNEKYEVIDGQARLEYAKRHSLIIPYVVRPGIGIKECIELNRSHSDWKIQQYITSYADRGFIAYVYLAQLIREFTPEFNLSTIYYSLFGLEPNRKAVEDGGLVCKADDYNEARACLTWLREFKPIIGKVGGYNKQYYKALSFCRRLDSVDNDRLLHNVQRMQAKLIPTATIYQALETIEEIYNFRTQNKVYLVTEYKKRLSEYKRAYKAAHQQNAKKEGVQ